MGIKNIRMETEEVIEYKSTIMEMRNIIKNQERVIEEMMLEILNIKVENEVGEAGEVYIYKKILNYFYKISLRKR
jgi:hypothetical protein